MKKSICLGLFILIIVSSCMKDSSLSDVEISDPSLIRPDISLTRTRDNSNRLETDIKVFLWDKNFDAVQLKKGSVSVNGNIMKVDKLVLTGAPYYTIDTTVLRVELNKTCTFIIELADGQQYEASITTQNVDLYELNLPSGYSKLNNMDISWKGSEIQNEFEILLTCNYSADSESGQTSDLFTPNYQERLSGTYIISKSYFNQKDNIYKASVKISSKKNGTIDPVFRSGATIYSYYEKISECNVN